MNRQQFIEKALEFGLSIGEGFWLEHIYSKDGDQVTVDDNHMLMDFFANLDLDAEESSDLIDLSEEYAEQVEQAKKDGLYDPGYYKPYTF